MNTETKQPTEVAEAPQPKPDPSATPKFSLTVTIFQDGHAEMNAPLDRGIIVMLLTAGFDLSYEFVKEQEARAQAAAAEAAKPKLRKWSREWWAQFFKAKPEERAAMKAAPSNLSEAEEAHGRIQAAKVEANLEQGGKNGADTIEGGAPGTNAPPAANEPATQGPAGGMPEGTTKH